MARPEDLETRLAALARITRAPSPVASLYLGTRWADEHRRERARVFVAGEVKKARAAADPTLAADLDWVAGEATALIARAEPAGAHGVALFACGPLGLRTTVPLRAPVEDLLVVAVAPHLRPLVEALDATPALLVVFVDGERARLVQVRHAGVGEEVTLASEMPSRHRQGGWALLAQTRYARHTETLRGRHFDAVAATLGELAEAHGVERVVLAGEPRTVAVFRQHLPAPLAAQVVGEVAGAWHEPAAALVERALVALRRQAGAAEAADVDAALTEAAKGGRGAAGVGATLAAAARGAVHRLYLLRTFRAPGRECGACGALAPGDGGSCRICGAVTKAVELGEALTHQVLAAGGAVETVEGHPGLARAEGIAASLRYPL
ncbi:MAG: host attachment protein [Candidatus Rokubacteria bacterium]|nr:host attachment protein [Candidatus Rokubacteria bacterium]